MPPTPTPTDDQIAEVREIAQIRDFQTAADLVNSLNDADWARGLAALAEWTRIHRKHVRFKGKGVDLDNERERLQIINEMRVLLGLPPIGLEGLLPSGYSVNTPRW